MASPILSRRQPIAAVRPKKSQKEDKFIEPKQFPYRGNLANYLQAKSVNGKCVRDKSVLTQQVEGSVIDPIGIDQDDDEKKSETSSLNSENLPATEEMMGAAVYLTHFRDASSTNPGNTSELGEEPEEDAERSGDDSSTVL